MNALPERSALKRLLVVFDPSSGSPPSLAAAAGLAARLQAELEVLFVEDTDLLSLGELQGARLVGEEARLGADELEAAVGALERRLRREAEALAAQLSLAWRFRSARASLRSAIPAAAEAADLVILERSARPFGALRLKATAFRAAESVARPLLVLSESCAIEQGVSVLVSGTAEDRAIAVGARIASALGTALQVRLLPADAAQAHGLEAHVHEMLATLAPDLRAAVAPSAEALPAAIRSFGGGLLVLDWANPELARHDGWKLAGEARCSLLIVR